MIWVHVFDKKGKRGRLLYRKNKCTLQTESDSDNSKRDGMMLPNHCDSTEVYNLYTAKSYTASGPPKGLEILSGSKQVSEETTQFFYQNNRFRVTCTCQLNALLSDQLFVANCVVSSLTSVDRRDLRRSSCSGSAIDSKSLRSLSVRPRDTFSRPRKSSMGFAVSPILAPNENHI